MKLRILCAVAIVLGVIAAMPAEAEAGCGGNGTGLFGGRLFGRLRAATTLRTRQVTTTQMTVSAPPLGFFNRNRRNVVTVPGTTVFTVGCPCGNNSAVVPAQPAAPPAPPPAPKTAPTVAPAASPVSFRSTTRTIVRSSCPGGVCPR